jgi:ATP-dependent Lhr-like helicase
MSEREEQLLAALRQSGASFFTQLHESVGGGYPGESLDALWSLVWRGLVTNDSLHPLRAYVARPESARANRKQHGNGTGAFRSRRTVPATAQGRWSLIETRNRAETLIAPSATEATHALALQLLNRYGVLLRECAAAENIPGGFSAIYPVLKALEESGRIRRGYFVAGLGATQFALPAAVDLLRSLRNAQRLREDGKPEFVLLAATDPANPYGSTLKWPDLPAESEDTESAPRVLTRAAYAQVVLCAGRLVAWLRRGNPNLLVFLPADEPERSQTAEGLARFLAELGQTRLQNDQTGSHHSGYLISTINGLPTAAHPLARALHDAGFHPGPLGMHLRRPATPPRTASPGLQPNRPARSKPP